MAPPPPPTPGPSPGPANGASGSRPGLGPHVVGQRVVVRRVLRGQSGPTGGPAFSDVLGVMERWSKTEAVVRREDGELVTIEIADIVSGKPVPPRPSVRLRVSADVAERRALAGWQALQTEPLGEWVLRASEGYTSRANSVLAVGDPGEPIALALGHVESFYAAHGLPAWAQVVVGSDVHQRVEAEGWAPARPGEADTLFQIASVASALRVVQRAQLPAVHQLELSGRAEEAWLADDPAALRRRATAVAVLEGSPEVAFATVRQPGNDRVVGKGRVARGSGSEPGDDEWAGITNVWVAPERRRSGLGTVVMGALLEWAAERGVSTAYLQVRGDNPGALAAYDRLGFMTHHAYRYLQAP